MGASTGIFKEPEIAVMVTVVLLTTLLTPIIMRGAFAIHCPEDDDEDQRTREEPLTYARVAETTGRGVEAEICDGFRQVNVCGFQVGRPGTSLSRSGQRGPSDHLQRHKHRNGTDQARM